MSLVINDLHLGVQRSGGTTLASQHKLKGYLLERLAWLLTQESCDVIVNGDLFDGFTVDVMDVIMTYEIFSEWLASSRQRSLQLVAGNHDWNPRADKLSSFHLLCHFLRARFAGQVHVHDKGFDYVSFKNYCIPHMPNQDLFDLEIEKAIEAGSDGGNLLLHCNYKNTFAENADHSLNLNDTQIGKLIMAGWNLILAHEHQGYELRGGRVKVVGNQFPSSVADCLGNYHKRALRINDDGSTEYLATWHRDEHYLEIDWHDLGSDFILRNFYRITGTATAEESADVISRIAKFRQGCCDDVFVVTNAVKIEGAVAAEDMAAETIETIKAFNVLDAIYQRLEPKQVDVVKELINAE